MHGNRLDLLTVEEVAAETRRSPSAVRQSIAKGQLRAAKLGRRWFVRRKDIEQMFETPSAAQS